MDFLLTLLLVVAIVAAAFAALALHWAKTPYGRLKPIFALTFRLTRLFGGERAEGVLDAKGMVDDDSTRRIRADFLKSTKPLSRPVAFAGDVEDRTLEGPGGELPVRIYTPRSGGPFPTLVYFHGGGFVVGHPDYTEPVTRGVAARAPAVVVSVDYRMAPEQPYPAAVEDACFAVEWAVEHAAELGARPGPVAVAGDSAGGNLAAVVAQRDAAAGGGRVARQVLIYPTVDLVEQGRPSQVDFATGYGLSMDDVRHCFGRYVPEDVEPGDPGVSPLRATSLAGLPPALVFTAGFDVLRDEGIEYVRALEKAGVDVEHVHRPELPHGYITMTRICREAEEDIGRIAAAVRKLGRTG